MNNKLVQFLYGSIALFSMSCARLPLNETKPNFMGHIYERKFNNMPMFDKPNSKGAAFSTTLYIYEPTTIRQIVDGGVPGQSIIGIQSQLIDSVQSDKNGQYSMYLKPGKYSVFAKYQNGYYVPFYSGREGVAIIETKQNEMTELDIIISSSNSIE